MPQRRKQQKGGTDFDFLDILSSDPKNQIIANNKKIDKLKKESEQKCDEIKKMNDQKIADLKKKNEELQKAADMKKAADAEEAKSESIFDGVKNFFGSKADNAKSGSDAAGPETGLVTGLVTGPVTGPGTGPVGEKNNLGFKPYANEEVRPAAPAAGGRLFGGKKSKRRRGSRARKSIKK